VAKLEPAVVGVGKGMTDDDQNKPSGVHPGDATFCDSVLNTKFLLEEDFPRFSWKHGSP
jgi:hypothetical protein